LQTDLSSLCLHRNGQVDNIFEWLKHQTMNAVMQKIYIVTDEYVAGFLECCVICNYTLYAHTHKSLRYICTGFLTWKHVWQPYIQIYTYVYIFSRPQYIISMVFLHFGFLFITSSREASSPEINDINQFICHLKLCVLK